MSHILVKSAGAVAAALLSASSLAGCSGGSSGSRAAPTTKAAQGGTKMEFRVAAADYPALSASLPERPLGTSGSSIAGLELEVWTLQRSGDQAMLLVFALHNPASTNAGPSFSTELEGLSAQAKALNATPGSAFATVSGVSAVDGSGLKQYLPFMARPDDDQTCVCSAVVQGDLHPGGRTYYAALLAAPPGTVKTMTVVTGVGSVANIGLS